MADIDIELLVIFGVFALGIFYLLLRLWPRAATEPDRGPSSEQYPKVVFERPYNRADSTDQLRAVMAATFTPRKVMQSAEYRAFLAVEQEVHASWRGCRVFAQTALPPQGGSSIARRMLMGGTRSTSVTSLCRLLGLAVVGQSADEPNFRADHKRGNALPTPVRPDTCERLENA